MRSHIWRGSNNPQDTCQILWIYLSCLSSTRGKGSEKVEKMTIVQYPGKHNENIPTILKSIAATISPLLHKLWFLILSKRDQPATEKQIISWSLDGEIQIQKNLMSTNLQKSYRNLMSNMVCHPLFKIWFNIMK